jgi:hypothetical protein
LVCEHTFVRTWGYTVAEHDPDCPWIVLVQRRETVELEDGESFRDWAARRYPDERFTVELEPWSDFGQRWNE